MHLGEVDLPALLLDRPIRRSVHRIARPHGAFLRFFIFLAVCSFGYAAVPLGCSVLMKMVLTINREALMAPIALGIPLAIDIIAGGSGSSEECGRLEALTSIRIPASGRRVHDPAHRVSGSEHRTSGPEGRAAVQRFVRVA
jgi:hypothetical protein